MKETLVISEKSLLPLWFKSKDLSWLVLGGGETALQTIKTLLHYSEKLSMSVICENLSQELRQLASRHANIRLVEKKYSLTDLEEADMLVIATDNTILDEKILSDSRQLKLMVYLPGNANESDFILHRKHDTSLNGFSNGAAVVKRQARSSDQKWRKLTSRLILAFLLMVLGHIIISYLPLPSISEIGKNIRPYFNYHFLFFVLAGFLAQMVDGVLSMGYGVTSATCLMSFGVNPVAMSAAIHTSEIFTTGISGYSHYRFGNVNKKLFRHLVVPGVLGAILGALLLVFLGETYGKWLMPLIALYAGFLGLKILIKAFGQNLINKKLKRVGWLAGVGGFLDSFGGGGWGPIVTSTLIAKGRSPKYTVGSVSLTEFFVTLSSAFTFFVTVGVSHWNIVLGLLIGGGLAAPIAARLSGRLPKKTMMIAVGIMVMIWCVRMFIKSFT